MRILRFIGLLMLVLLTATLFAEKRPKIMLINSNASVERYRVAQEEFKKAAELPVLEVNLETEAKRAAKQQGTGEDVLSVLRRLGKL